MIQGSRRRMNLLGEVGKQISNQRDVIFQKIVIFITKGYETLEILYSYIRVYAVWSLRYTVVANEARNFVASLATVWLSFVAMVSRQYESTLSTTELNIFYSWV